MSKKITFFVVGILGLLKIIILLTTGSLFGIVYCAAWLVWLSLILFAIFMWFFYNFAFKSLYSWKFIAIFLFIVVTVICAVGFFARAVDFTGLKLNTPSQESAI